MKRLTFVICCLLVGSCNKEEVMVVSDAEQLKIDVEAIDQYLLKNAIVAVKDPSGLRYVVHQPGAGSIPLASSFLKVNYEGRYLTTEQIFDKSSTPVRFFTFPVDNLIHGWQIAFSNLPKGSIATLYIPSGLAYGKAGAGPIPPNSNLIFDVNFIDIREPWYVLDADDNVYTPDTLGNQIWLKENMKTSSYTDGILIGSGGWSFYGSDSQNEIDYGRLYSYATVTNAHGLCPTGYHAPSEAEWEEMITFLGGNSVAGAKMKETGTTHWTDPNVGADNSSGFTALPGGYKADNGTFLQLGLNAFWWSTKNVSSTNGSYYGIANNASSIVSNEISKSSQLSVRCVKD